MLLDIIGPIAFVAMIVLGVATIVLRGRERAAWIEKRMEENRTNKREETHVDVTNAPEE